MFSNITTTNFIFYIYIIYTYAYHSLNNMDIINLNNLSNLNYFDITSAIITKKERIELFLIIIY